MPNEAINWRAVAARMWAAQSRADLNERPRLLLSVLIKATVEQGRLQLLVPDMGELFAVLGIGKTHHREVRVALMDAGMVEFAQVHEGWRVTMFADPAQWRCGWYYEDAALTAWLERMNALPGQAQYECLPPEPSLTLARAELSAENAVMAGNGVSYQNGNSGERNGNSGERSVTKMVTRPVLVPVTGTPVKQALKAGTASELVTSTSERDVLQRLKAFLARSPHQKDREDFGYWSGSWRKLARMNPLLSRVLAELECKEREGWEANTSRVGALKDLLKRWNQNE